MTYDTQGRRVLQGHPQSWDDVMGVKHVSHPSTWEAEAKALRAENAKLEGEKAVLQVGCNKAMQRVQELEAALTWYRDQHRISGKPTIDAEWAATRLKTDGGARADAALQKQEGE